jgi:hypothetical protein
VFALAKANLDALDIGEFCPATGANNHAFALEFVQITANGGKRRIGVFDQGLDTGQAVLIEVLANFVVALFKHRQTSREITKAIIFLLNLISFNQIIIPIAQNQSYDCGSARI